MSHNEVNCLVAELDEEINYQFERDLKDALGSKETRKEVSGS
jgi:hypothetical protein